MSSSATSGKLFIGSSEESGSGLSVQLLMIAQQPPPPLAATATRRRWSWWLLVAIYVLVLLVGQTAATLLQRFYYSQGGYSKWIQTLIFSAGFPVLYIPLLVTPSATSDRDSKPPLLKISLIYVALGLINTADNLMYSYGLLWLSVSTYTLISTSQLAFNTLLSYLINSEKLTHLSINSVVLLTFSASVLGVHSDEDPSSSSNTPGGKYALGFLLPLSASATYALVLSLMELTFQKVIKKQTVKAVLEMQIYTAAVSTAGTVVGLFASGEWKGVRKEMEGFGKGKAGYVMTLVWASVSWQVTNVGLVGLIFEVSSLFSNVISTLAIPLVPLFAVILFRDKMDGIKIISLLLALWGSASYFYQHYIDFVLDREKSELQGRGEALED